MAKNGILVLGFILFFFRFGSATYCSYNSDCDQWLSETCCPADWVCRRTCYCSYDSECGLGETCCYGACMSSCATAVPMNSSSSPMIYATRAMTHATRATYCSDSSDCDQRSGESCCSDSVCRKNCYVRCTYDFQCSSGEKCCNGYCLSYCPTPSPSPTTRATHCSDNSDCDQRSGESCCSDDVCRKNCYNYVHCSDDSQCGSGEECCFGACLSSCPTAYSTLATVAPTSYCTLDSDCELDDVCCDGDCLTVCPSSSWSGASIAGTVFGTIVFLAVIFSLVSCYFCAWCPYYRYRSPRAVIISGQVPYQPFVTTTQTTMTQNVPPPPNYNQPPPSGCQPPPSYSSYPQQPAQHPPAATASGQPPMAPKVTA